MRELLGVEDDMLAWAGGWVGEGGGAGDAVWRPAEQWGQGPRRRRLRRTSALVRGDQGIFPCARLWQRASSGMQ